MASQNRPASKDDAPDPARSYGREKPETESGMGRLDNNDDATPAEDPDRAEDAVKNKQDPTRQLNAQDVVNQRATRGGASEQARSSEPDRTMADDEQIDTDTIPQESSNPREKRNPRVGGKGGTPDAGESRRQG
ncbi:MAG TPA: hypothetical protein VL282_11055 [Tepidisphaeraceae bacterium]|jgi:hypothetical protein|nr:hypothetical protein [Tepidisphaeraceae bacterium]